MPSNATGERIAGNVRAEMARHGYTQVRLAAELGKTQQFISRRLSGRVAFTVTELDAIARVLGVPLSNLIVEAVA